MSVKKRLAGSYTIEAALIFPLIMTVIVFLIYCSFYLHDRAVMQSCAYQAALKGSMERRSDEDMAREAKRAADYNIEGLLLRTEGIETRVDVSGSSVTVSYSGYLMVPQNIVFMKIAGFDEIKVEGSSSASKKDAIEFIRMCRGTKNLAENVGGE